RLAQRPMDCGTGSRARRLPETVERAANPQHDRATENFSHHHVAGRFPERLKIARLDLDDRRPAPRDDPGILDDVPQRDERTFDNSPESTPQHRRITVIVAPGIGFGRTRGGEGYEVVLELQPGAGHVAHERGYASPGRRPRAYHQHLGTSGLIHAASASGSTR